MHANDVFFAFHAVVVTALTLFQCAIYDRGGQRVSWLAGLGTAGSLAGIAAYLAAVIWAQQGSSGGGGYVPPGHTGLTLVPTLWFRSGGSSSLGGGSSSLGGGTLPCGDLLSWLSFLYFLSYIKLAVSLVKYIPQVCGWVCPFCVLVCCLIQAGGLVCCLNQAGGVPCRLVKYIPQVCWLVVSGPW